MSLIDEMMDSCVIMNKTKVSDGEGGYNTVWTEGATIKAAIVHNSSIQARIGEKEGVTSVYTITTKRNVILDFHDVIKRVKDGHIFRVTSDAGDNVSPNVSTLSIAQVSAEKWELTQ